MHLYSADRAEPLAKCLADVLSTDPRDPMASEWLAVPTEGMRRWLTLELAKYLGSSSPGAVDGIAANIIRAFPGTLRSAVLEAGSGGGLSPWHIDRMVWSLMPVFDDLADRGTEPQFTELADGASRYSRIRAVADLFDRYHLHRPEMIHAWADGAAIDGSGKRLSPHLAWQQRVWTQLRDQIARPSPPEQFRALLELVRSDELSIDLPERLILFGFTSLPGRDFLDLVSAVSSHRTVHLFLLEPSRLDRTRLLEAWPTPDTGMHRLRAEDSTEKLVHQPLLRTWGRLARETTILLADAASEGLPSPVDVTPDAEPGPTSSTLLARLQGDIRSNSTPQPAVVDPDDRSVQFHACFGQMRQVEVARDALLHLLDAEPDIDEEDILIVCPGLESFAPLVEAAFGSWTQPTQEGDEGGPVVPRLRFRIADRSISTANPVVGAVVQFLDLLSGRFEVTPVVDFISSLPVRQRFDIDDDAMAAMIDWVTRTRVRWGLDVTHRANYSMPVAITGNTWQAGLDRLLMGAAAEGDEFVLAVGDIAPCAVDSGDVETLGSLAFVLGHLAEFTQWAESGRHPVADWISRLRASCQRLFAVEEPLTWQVDALQRVLGDILESSGAIGDGITPMVDLLDMRRLLAGKLADEAGRPDFFRGGITVTSMTPLRWVPFKVVCILGLDQEFVGSSAADAADLVAASPQVGDPDRRIEARQSLLEAVLAARDHLIVVREGQDVRSNQLVPRVVAGAELFDAVVALASPAQRDDLADRLEITHPRHTFDETCLHVGGLMPGIAWSFDPGDQDRAEARRAGLSVERVSAPQRIAAGPTDVIDLADLRAFLLDPVAAFASAAVQMSFSRPAEADDVVLPVEPGLLARAGLGRRLLDARRAGVTSDEWLAVERRVGTLPPHALEPKMTDSLVTGVNELVDAADRLGVRSGEAEYQDIDVVLADGTRIVGSVQLLLADSTPGPARIRYVRPKPTFELEAWLDLMALVATDPGRSWRSVSVSRGEGDDPTTVIDRVVGGDPAQHAANAARALEVVVHCFRAGMQEPLPLFPNFSKTVADGDPNWAKWSNYNGWGDAGNPATAFFFGAYTGAELMAIASVEGDPPGVGGRVKLWAHYLWDAVGATSTEYAQ